MRGRVTAAMVGAATVGLAMAVGIVLWPESPTSTPAADSPQETVAGTERVTLTLSASGGRDATVVYTCPTQSDVTTCGPTSFPAGENVWSTQITVPVGVTVRLEVQGSGIPPMCVISDETDQLVLDRQSERCSAVAE